MSSRDPGYADPEMVLEFLRNTLPFSELDEADLRALAKGCSIDFQPANTMILEKDVTPVSGLLLVQKGGVRIFTTNERGEDILVDFRGEGDSIGGLAMLQGGRALFNAATVEDTFFLCLQGAAFTRLLEKRPHIAHYYSKALCEQYVSKAFDALRSRKEPVLCGGGLSLLRTRVTDLLHRPPVTTAMGGTIQQAAQHMVRHGIGSLLITDPSGDIIGIVTDKDLRKGISLGMDLNAPVETIMTAPVICVEHQDLCFEALLQMMDRNIHHLAVKQDSAIIGVVTSHDIMVMQGKSPMSLFREIISQHDFEGLYPLGGRIPQVVRTLVEEGAKAGNIARMITVINDMMVSKVLSLLLERLGPPPVPFCWLLMGSEGRKEQTFFTDQDNALIYGDAHDPAIQSAADIYFKAFAERAIDHLVKCGLPPCPGDIMASNPRWRQPYSVWRDYFERWIAVNTPEEVMHAAIFFDFRSVFGKAAFAAELRSHVTLHTKRQDVFLRHMAANCLETRPPLSFFRNFIVEKNGEHKNRLDIKKRGITPLVNCARVLALQHGVRDTNTLGRLQAVHESGHLPQDLYVDAREAYEFMLHLRLVHQLESAERGEAPHNHIAPHSLSELEKKTLKEAFALIGRFQTHIRDLFRLNIA